MDALLDARALVELICQIRKDVESEMRETESQEANMKPYWMVHRFGRQSGQPNKVYHSFENAYREAQRLARKERDRFVILQAHTMIKPYEPMVITVETIGDPPVGIPYPDSLDEKVSGCTCEPSESANDRCCAHDEPELCPAEQSGRMDDCTCGTPKRDQHASSGCTY